MALTNEDLQQIRELLLENNEALRVRWKEDIQENNGTLRNQWKEDIQENTRNLLEYMNQVEKRLNEHIDDRVDSLPTRDDFFDRTDQILGHDKKTDEELALLNDRLSVLEAEVEQLKQKVG